jgi:hypothetical protein
LHAELDLDDRHRCKQTALTKRSRVFRELGFLRTR